MGSFGAKGVKEVIETNTQIVVRYSSVPVLAVKRKPQKFKDNHIVFASTFEEEVQKPFQKIVDFAEFMDAKIHLLNVNVTYNFKETDEAEANMQSFLSKSEK